MPLTIISLKNKTNKLRAFKAKEWELIHPEHFGTKQDPDYWKKERVVFKGVESKKIVGVLIGDYTAGVMYIDQLIVKHDQRSKGVGKALMDKAFELAKKANLHKIYLYTGNNWQAIQFYKSLGLAIEAEISNFYQNKDFVIMSKDLR